MDRARALFLQVLDAPGGMKIQTIHAFCQSVLGRFPLEARINPHFSVMDERTEGETLRNARDAVIAEAGAPPIPRSPGPLLPLPCGAARAASTA